MPIPDPENAQKWPNPDPEKAKMGVRSFMANPANQHGGENGKVGYTNRSALVK